MVKSMDYSAGSNLLINKDVKKDNNSERKITTVEKQALVDKYIEQIKTISSSHLSEKSGEIEGVKFNTVLSAGKQQPTPIMNLSFPEGVSFDIVFRPTHGEFAELYKEHEVVRKYFPHLFSAVEVPRPTRTSLTSKVLILERINGHDHKFGNVKYQELLKNPNNFESLCQETFEMVDDLYQLPIVLSDIGPTGGHNVIYNTDTNKFQFFDVDTIHHSDLPIDRKFMNFCNPQKPLSDDKEILYYMRMVQQYLDKYPAGFSSYEGEDTVRGTVIKADEATELKDASESLIYPDNPAYKDLYKALGQKDVVALSSLKEEDLPILKLLKTKGKDVSSFDKDFIEAVKENNFEKAKERIVKLRGNLIETEFLPTAS